MFKYYLGLIAIKEITDFAGSKCPLLISKGAFFSSMLGKDELKRAITPCIATATKAMRLQRAFQIWYNGEIISKLKQNSKSVYRSAVEICQGSLNHPPQYMLTIHAKDDIFFHGNEKRFFFNWKPVERDQIHFERVSSRVSNHIVTTLVCSKLKIVISTEMCQVYP